MIDTFDAFLSERRYTVSAIRVAKKHIRLIHEAGYTDDDIRRIDGFYFGLILDVNTKYKSNPWVRAVNMYRAYLRARDNQTIKCFTCKHAAVDFLDDMYSGQRVVSICCHGFPEKGVDWYCVPCVECAQYSRKVEAVEDDDC